MPRGKTAKVGVWENSRFIGAVVFALGANQSIKNLNGKKTAELARVALSVHKTPVTRIIKIALKLFVKFCPGIEQIISYADMDRGHEGVIYRAGNWEYCGMIVAEWIKLNGCIVHPKTINARYGTCSIEWLRNNVDKTASKVPTKGKHKFIYKLTNRARSKDSVASSSQLEEGGAIPTLALSSPDPSRQSQPPAQ